MIVRNVVSVASAGLAAIVGALGNVASVQDLSSLLADICAEIGFSHFALADHVDVQRAPESAIRLHNYPAELDRLHTEQRLGPSDPVHRACQRTAMGFTWSDLPTFIELTPRDRRILQAAGEYGIVDGFTVPVHQPGQFSGSCSFATDSRVAMEARTVADAQLLGTLAFQAARRLTTTPHARCPEKVHLSDRERECLVWIGRGKSNPEIATILGISTHTVNQYVKHALASFDVVSRSQLVVQALAAGAITFLDLAGR